jgi:hypothetical protein
MHQFFVLSFVALLLLGATSSAQRDKEIATAGFPQQASGVLEPVLTTSEFRVGQNRVAFWLLLNETTFVADAAVVVRVYALHARQPQLQTEMRAFYGTLESSERGYRVSLHADGTPRAFGTTITAAQGIYVARVSFDQPGSWGLEVFIAQDDGPVEVARLTVHVLATLSAPVAGAAGP